MKKLLICTVNMLTGQSNTQRTLDEAIGQIRYCAEQANGWMQNPSFNLEDGNAFQAILVAPEYMFIASHPTDRLPITASERDRVEAALRDLSRQYPKILMIPGTVFYQEPMNAQKAVEAKANVLAAELAARFRATRGGVRKGIAKPSKLFQSRAPENRGLNVVQARPIPSRVGLSEEMDALELGEGRSDYWGQKPGLINVVTGLSATSVRARNRAYIFLKGELMAFYDKHSDFYEVGKAPDKYFFVPGTTEHCPVIGGFRFGLEICADHRLGVVARRRVSNLDFQVVMSDSIDVMSANIAVRVGGYYVHASSNPKSTGVMGRTAMGLIGRSGFAPKDYIRVPRMDGVAVDIPRRT